MIEDFEKVKKQLAELAPLINSFKSESVQLKLVELLFANAESSEMGIVRVSEAKKSPRKARKSKSSSVDSSAKGAVKKKPARSGPGAHAVVTSLYEEGFFKNAQTIGSIIAYCSNNKGLHFKANQISPTLLRLLRDNKLKRAKNSDKQYEYTEA